MWRPLGIPIALVGLLALLAGCRGGKPEVTFTSLDRSRELRQQFSLAAMSRDAMGDYDLVLVSPGDAGDGSWWRTTARTIGSAINPVSWLRRPGDPPPLTPTSTTPVRQVLHLKIHWRPRAGSSPENPAAANATVRWLVEGPQDATDLQPDLVEYQGTGFVRVRFGRDGYRLWFREGLLNPTRLDGDMVDVLGPNRFAGHAVVADDAFTVRQVLAGLPEAAVLPTPPPPERVRPATRPALSNPRR